jgi:ABC-type polysaccharide/polyol phosphate export permease
LRQFNLPREILPLSCVLAHFLNFLVGWVVLYPVFLFFNPKIILLLPFLCIIILLHLVLLLGLGLLLSVLTVLFRDIVYLLSVALMFLFWITPVFYSTAVMPAQFQWIFNFNPMVPFILAYQKILYYGVIPETFLILSVFSWSVMSVILGFIVFSRLENKILKNI